MSEKKPNVFPTKEQRQAAEEQARLAAEQQARIDAYEAGKPIVMDEVYSRVKTEDTPYGHVDAVEMMRRRTEEQMKMREQGQIVRDPSLAEVPAPRPLTRQEQEILEIRKKSEEQMRIRDEHLANNLRQTQSYQQQFEKASERKNNAQETYQPQPSAPAKKPIMQPTNYGQVPSNVNPYIMELSQPNYNSPFDVLPLPSQGKLYRTKKANVKVSYMTTADENILSSPNLLQSGEFLQILMDRKILESDLRYKDLHVGDRNAIMLWLRATGYGEMYPVTILDENNEPFETEINLNELKYKPLGAEPDAEGFFDFQLPLSKSFIKFRLLTCGDIDDIERIIETEKENGIPVNNSNVYKLERMIVEVNGDRDRNLIRNFASNLRVNDGKALNDYIDKIESGVDLNITVGTPGGGSVNTFLPLNVSFFWPNFRL
jgi:hypothetical protein